MSYDEVLHDDFQFDIEAHDVMVFLHIQKTGGTSFGKHLVMDLDLKVIRKTNPPILNIAPMLISFSFNFSEAVQLSASSQTLPLLQAAQQRDMAIFTLLDRMEVSVVVGILNAARSSVAL